MSGCAFICRRNIPVLSQICLPTLYNTCIQKWAVCAVFFFLLPDKTEETYRNMFQHLVECCTYLQLILNISCLHLDFEHATHNAARAIWPGIDIKGCQFDHSQSWWRKVQSLGLAAEYINPQSDDDNWIKSFFGLRKMACKEHYHPQFKPSCKYTCKQFYSFILPVLPVDYFH